MEFSSAIYRGDPCPEFSFSFKYLFLKNTPVKNRSFASFAVARVLDPAYSR